MKSPKISLLIPTYNYAQYLPEAIESVLEQDFSEYEILIIDDCSTDNSAEIVRYYAQKDSRIRYRLNSPNMGMVPNWNLCIKEARGAYLKFLFGDDKLCGRQALGRMAALLDEHEEVSLVASARTILERNSSIIDVWNPLKKTSIMEGTDVILRCFASTQNLIGEPSAVLFRKKQASRGFDTRYKQLVDLEFWMHLLEQGNLAYIAEPLCAFRVHPTQQTALNRVNGVGEMEYRSLLAEYIFKPYVKEKSRGRRIFFNNLYNLRRNRHNRVSSTLEDRLMHSLGRNWYCFFWILHKLMRPFQNFKNSLLKQTLHRFPWFFTRHSFRKSVTT